MKLAASHNHFFMSRTVICQMLVCAFMLTAAPLVHAQTIQSMQTAPAVSNAESSPPNTPNVPNTAPNWMPPPSKPVLVEAPVPTITGPITNTNVTADATIANASDSSDIATAVVEHYPAGAIKSVEMADQALTEMSSAKNYIETQSADQQRLCYEKFFTNACLDAIKNKRRLSLKKIRPVEVEANAFKRRTTADDRDKALADLQAKEAIDAPKRMQEAKDKEASNARQMQANQQKDKEVQANTALHAGESEKRLADHAAKVQATTQIEAAKASERAANVAAFNKKAQDAAARQSEVALKKAEKERDLAEKKAAAAVKP